MQDLEAENVAAWQVYDRNCEEEDEEPISLDPDSINVGMDGPDGPDDEEGDDDSFFDQFLDPNKEAREAIMRRLDLTKATAKVLIDKGFFYLAVVSRLLLIRVCQKFKYLYDRALGVLLRPHKKAVLPTCVCSQLFQPVYTLLLYPPASTCALSHATRTRFCFFLFSSQLPLDSTAPAYVLNLAIAISSICTGI